MGVRVPFVLWNVRASVIFCSNLFIVLAFQTDITESAHSKDDLLDCIFCLLLSLAMQTIARTETIVFELIACLCKVEHFLRSYSLVYQLSTFSAALYSRSCHYQAFVSPGTLLLLVITISSASEVTTLWRYTNVFIIIIIIASYFWLFSYCHLKVR